MAAPKGNQFWLARSTHGRKPIFQDADTLWKAATEYFQWCEDNPLIESKVASDSGTPVLMEVPKMRAMTIAGLCLFLDISHDAWLDYRSREDFIGVTKVIDDTIRTQKFAGASAGLLNANIIARDLGLKESTTNEHTGKDGGPIEHASFEFVPVGPDD